MKILLDIKDEKADFILELLQNFEFVKVKPLTPYFWRRDESPSVREGIKDAVEEMKLIKEGKLKGIPAEDLLDEL